MISGLSSKPLPKLVNPISEQFSQISSTTVDSKNKIDVRAKLAETAGVSTDTYFKGKKILDSNNEKLKQEVLSGEKSINAGYKELTGKKRISIYNRFQIWKRCITRIVITSDSTKLCSETIFKSEPDSQIWERCISSQK